MKASRLSRHAAKQLGFPFQNQLRSLSIVHDVPRGAGRSWANPYTTSSTRTPFNIPESSQCIGCQKRLDKTGNRRNTPDTFDGTCFRCFYSTPPISLPSAVQLCTLMNIKTGGCTEDCSYCAQASRYNTGLTATKMSNVESVIEAARIAKANGSNRFCMGAAWRDMRGRSRGMKNVVEMVKGVRGLGMEACVTLGMLDKEQAKELAEAGLTAYNHNVDTSREHYPKVITTRSYDERLQTLENVREAGIHVCSGGILGLGEVPATDHVGLIHTLATLPAHPESFPVNKLVPIKGTPMYGQEPVKIEDIVRCIATARLVMPATIIRLAAGRVSMPESEQMLCFMAGANAVFTGEKMLTTDCNGWEEDKAMFERWGLKPMQTEASRVVVEEDAKFEGRPFAEMRADAKPEATA